MDSCAYGSPVWLLHCLPELHAGLPAQRTAAGSWAAHALRVAGMQSPAPHHRRCLPASAHSRTTPAGTRQSQHKAVMQTVSTQSMHTCPFHKTLRPRQQAQPAACAPAPMLGLHRHSKPLPCHQAATPNAAQITCAPQGSAGDTSAPA